MRRDRGQTACVAAGTALAVLLAARSARANGRIAGAHQLVASPVDQTYLALETTFGILVSHDSGASWGWICEDAVGYGAALTEDPAIAIVQRSLLVAMNEGLGVSPDQGCAWRIPIAHPVVDVAVRRDGSGFALALASRFAGVSDGGDNLYETQVLVTLDAGATWAPQGGALDPLVQAETIDVAASDPMRVYVSGSKRVPAPDGSIVRAGVLLTSKDGGAHYTESQTPLAAGETQASAFVAAVDPQNADRLYVRVRGDAPMRIMASVDGGQTFRIVFQGKGALPGFALSPDGSKVYAGGDLDGVLEAPASTLQFVRKSATAVECLAAVGSTLYACTTDWDSRQLIAVSTDDGATFTPRFYLGCVSTTPACSPMSATARCDAGILINVGDCVQPDAGPTAPGDAASPDGASHGDGGGMPASGEGPEDAASDDGGEGDGGAPGPEPRGGCSCGPGGAVGTGGLMALAMLGVLAARRSRRLSCSARRTRARRPASGVEPG